MLIHGRYDRMMPTEVSIVILNHICRVAPLAAQQLRPLAALREAGRVDHPGPRVSAGAARNRSFDANSLTISQTYGCYPT